MKERIKKIIRLTIGWLLLFLGVIGLFLPFLQGILFILGGLAVLSREYAWARRWLIWCKAKFKHKASDSQSTMLKNKSYSGKRPDSYGTNEQPASPNPSGAQNSGNSESASGTGASESSEERNQRLQSIEVRENIHFPE